jgi:hypothetical protein
MEVEFLTRLNFPHLINIVDHFIDAKIMTAQTNWKETKRPMIVLELAEGG